MLRRSNLRRFSAHSSSIFAALLAAAVLLIVPPAVRAAITATGDVDPNPPIDGDNLDIGDSGLGTLLIDGGSSLTSSYVQIGGFGGGIGFATVTGPGSSWNIYDAEIGNYGIGRLEVLDGAHVEVGQNGLRLSANEQGISTVVVDGLGSVLRVDSRFDLGDQFGGGTARLRILNEAIVDVPSDETEVSSISRIELNNGLLRTWRLQNYGLITGSGQIQALNQSGTVNYGRIEARAGENLVVGSHIDNFGTIAADGGEIEFTGQVTNQSFNGTPQVTLEDGAVRFTGGFLNYGNLAALGGVNDVYGFIQNNGQGSVLATNNSLLTFHDSFLGGINDILVHQGSSVLFLEEVDLYGSLRFTIGDEDAPTPIQTVAQTNLFADLHVSFGEAYTPQVGDIFPLVSGVQLASDIFSAELPELPLGMIWQLDQNTSGIQLQIAAGLAGDYNNNGQVDAADYGMWRDAMYYGHELANDPTPIMVDESDYDYWRNHFGETLGSGAGAGSAGASPSPLAVPEPSALVSLCLGLLLASLSRARRCIC